MLRLAGTAHRKSSSDQPGEGKGREGRDKERRGTAKGGNEGYVQIEED